MNRRNQPSQGEFPFPVLCGEEESKYVTWIRNNSSYLKLGGVLGLFQAIATYVRGVLGVLAVLAPVLMIAGMGIGLLHFTMLAYPFVFTKSLTAIAVVCVLAFYALRAGDSQFKQPKRFAGKLLIALAVSCLFELSPHLIKYARDYLSLQFGFREFTSAIVSLASTAGLIIRYLPESKSIRRSAIIFVLSLIGVSLTWLVVLQVANYVAYGLPAHSWQMLIPVTSVACLFVLAGLFAWKSSQVPMPMRLIAIAICFFGIACCWHFRSAIFSDQIYQSSESASQQIGTLTRPLKRVVDGFSFRDEANLPERLESQIAEISAMVDDLDQQGSLTVSQETNINTWYYDVILPDRKTRIPIDPNYFSNASKFLERSEELGGVSDANRNRLLVVLANNARLEMAKNAGLEGARRNMLVRDAALREIAAKFARQAITSSKKWEQLDFEYQLQGDWLPVDVKDLAEQYRNSRTPISLAKSFLELTGRKDELKLFDNASAPDQMLNGPLISQESSSDSHKFLGKTIYETLARHPDEVRFQELMEACHEHVAESDKRHFSEHEFPQLQLVQKVEQLSFEDLCRLVLENELIAKSRALWRGLGLEPGLLDSEQKRLLGDDSSGLTKKIARKRLFEIGLTRLGANPSFAIQEEKRKASLLLADLYDPEVPILKDIITEPGESAEELAFKFYRRKPGERFDEDEIAEFLGRSFVSSNSLEADKLLRRMVYGRFAELDQRDYCGTNSSRGTCKS